MYKALIQPIEPVVNNRIIWKMKTPLKTKVFTWYLHRGIILTKDNLAKFNWHGSKRCVFLSSGGDYKTLFLPMPTINHPNRFYLIPPQSIANIFGNCLNGVDHRFKILIR